MRRSFDGAGYIYEKEYLQAEALAFKQANMDEMFFFYVAGISAMAFIASLCMPNLKKHGYLDGDGKVEANTPPFRRAK